jgi:AMP-polyphosphate phosphotransferase
MQLTMQAIQQAYLGTRERAVVVLEGWDAAGKGRVVRRLGWALDPRSFKVYPVAAPASHQKGKHYLPGGLIWRNKRWLIRDRIEGPDD